MASFNSVGSKNNDGNFFHACFSPLVRGVKPSLKKGETEFRIIPEIDDQGNIRPMVLGSNPDGGLDFSNVRPEVLVNGLGETHKITGWSRVADRPDRDRSVSQPLAAYYIRMKAKDKKNELPDAIALKFSKQTKKPDMTKPAQVERPADVGLVQAVLVRWPGMKPEDKMRPKQVILLPTTACRAVNELLEAAWKNDKLDAFAPSTGVTIILSEKPGSDGKAYAARFGQAFPLTDDQCKALWVPWDKALVFRTLREQLEELIKAVSYPMVEHVFHDELQEVGLLRSAEPVAPVTVPAPARPAPVTRPAAPVSSAVGGLSLNVSTDVPADHLPGDEPDAPAAPVTPTVRPSLTAGIADAEALAEKFRKELGGL